MKKITNIRTFIQDFFVTFRMLRDFLTGDYKDLSLVSFIMIIASFIYLACPVDLVSDVVPFVGLLDDATVFAFVYGLVRSNVQNYKEWTRKEIA